VGRGASLDKIGRDDSRDDRGGHAFVDPYPTSLHQAVYVGNREIFDIILDFPTSTPESRARIAATVTGLTTLEIAYLGSGLGRREDRAYITRKLVQHAARLPEDREVLVRACKNGAFRTVLDFLESGACRLPSIENLPALLYQSLRPPPPRHQFTQGLDWVDRHFLARPEIRLRDRLDLLRVLLESGVDVSTLHYYIGKGLSPLMLAAHPGHPADTALELIKLILAHGGRPGWTNSGGMTVLHYVAKVLTTPAPGQRLPAVRPFYPPPVEVIRYLLQQGGLHVDAEDNTGRTALDYVYAGIQPYVENRTRRNKLSHMWVRQGVEIAECILEHSKDRMSQEIVAREMARLNHARQELQQAEARAERASKEVRHS
jgi:ankyrin repeat protein